MKNVFLPAVAVLTAVTVYAAMSPEKTGQLFSDLHTTNRMEIDLGELAQQKASAPSVKSFGQRMVRDHTDADQKLQRVAREQNITIQAKPKMGHDSMMDGLMKKEGAEFDRAYIDMMVADHRKDVQKVTSAEKETAPGPVRDLLTQLRPILEEHEREARQIQASLKAKT